MLRPISIHADGLLKIIDVDGKLDAGHERSGHRETTKAVGASSWASIPYP
jgi:hypothetical protein